MQKNFTRFDLIRFCYNEVSPAERNAIKEQLGVDQRMRHEYEVMCQLTESLDSFSMDPSDSTIEMILEHSDHLEHTH